MPIQTQFFNPALPRAGKVWGLTHTATAARFQIPPEWRGKFVTFYSQTSNMAIALGDGGVMVDIASVSVTALSEVLTSRRSMGAPISAGSYYTFYCPTLSESQDTTHMAIDSDGTSGIWYAWISDNPCVEEPMPQGLVPALWLDANRYDTFSLSGTDVASWTSREGRGYVFSEGTNRPVWTVGSATSNCNGRASVAFTAGNSDKLVCTDANCAAIFDASSAYTLFTVVYRGATGAVHTPISVGTNGSANGRQDWSFDASDDWVSTRVDSGGSSTALTYATTISAAYRIFSYTFDGTSTAAMYVARASVSTSGSNSGALGTLSKVSLGCRGYNTATYDQFLTGEIGEIIAFDRVLSAIELTNMHAWLQRRHAV